MKWIPMMRPIRWCKDKKIDIPFFYRELYRYFVISVLRYTTASVNPDGGAP